MRAVDSRLTAWFASRRPWRRTLGAGIGLLIMAYASDCSAQPPAQADTWVSIGPVVHPNPLPSQPTLWSVDIWAGNAGTAEPVFGVYISVGVNLPAPTKGGGHAMARTQSSPPSCAVLITPQDLWLVHGQTYRVARFVVTYAPQPTRPVPSVPAAPVNFTISAAAYYDRGSVSQFETNTANNQQTVTYAFPPGGTPQCLKVVGMDYNIFRSELYPVFSSPRCINCHGRVKPQNNNQAGANHNAPVGEPIADSANCNVGSGHCVPCINCHQKMSPPFTNTGAPSFVRWDNTDAPLDPGWMCLTVGFSQVGSSLGLLQQHISTDPRIQWAFDPDQHQLCPCGPAPGGYQVWQQNMLKWFNQGKPCPPVPSP